MSAPRSSFLRSDPSDRHGYSNPSSPGLTGDLDGNGNSGGGSIGGGGDSYYNPKPTFATFSPITSLSGGKSKTSASASAAASTASAAKHRSTILVHQKSPLLLATPPQITRSLAYSHPFLLPLNKLAGLISWTTDDPWESFILVLVWWLTVLYGDTIIRFAGPIVLVLTLIAGMYGRKYSPLSTSGWSNDDDIVPTNATNTSHSTRKSNTVTTGSGIGYFLFGMGAGSTKDSQSTGNDAASGKARSRAKNHSIDSTAGRGANLDVAGGAAANTSGHQRTVSEIATTTRHQKTLDEIVETLREFTARCNLLLEPMLELTDFLSTQSTPTSATTRPALTVLFVRILLCTPFWYLLTLPPWRIITTRRVALVFGTLILTWHSRVMRVSRTILWRSATIRRAAALVTGLEFEGPMRPSKSPSYVTAGGPNSSAAANLDDASTPATAAAALNSKLSSTKPARRLSTPRESELTKAIRRARAGQDAGVRFTFILYENQRRWVGLGWTTNLFSYERPSWTDEHNNAVPTKDEFELPEVEDGSKMQWRWVEGSRWRVDGVVDDAVRVEKTTTDGEHQDAWDYDGEGGRMGWVYYDNKWQNGRRGSDGWNRWTRRRKWFRDAELVEVELDENADEDTSVHDGHSLETAAPAPGSPSLSHSGTVGTSGSSEAPGTFPGSGSVNGTADVDASSVTSGGGGGGSIFSFGGGSRDTNTSANYSNYDGADNTDAASIMSTSSRSRFRPPTLRRRVTDASSRGVAAPAVTTNTVATALPSNGVTPITISAHSRGNSEAEEDADVVSSSVGVKPHLSSSSSGGQGGWGYGDEAYMGLD